MLYGLWKRRCQTLESRNALGWLQHGYLEQAQDTLLLAMSKHANKAYETGNATRAPYPSTLAHSSSPRRSLSPLRCLRSLF